MKTSHKSDELNNLKRGGGVHKSGTYAYGSLRVIQPNLKCTYAGADPGLQVRGSALKKIASSGWRGENVWGISCEKSRFYAKKIIFFPILEPPLDPPLHMSLIRTL